jgi:hypothetical protein
VLGHVTALDGLIARYSWVQEIEAWTVAVIEGRSADEIIRVYGGDPATSVGDYYFAQLADLQGPGEPEPLRFHLQVSTHERFVVATENNGWTGSIPEIARRCSAGAGRFFSVYWNANAFGMLTQAIGGTVTASFEFLYPLAPEAYPPEIRPDWAIGPEIEPNLARQACFALLEQQTGLRFDRDWLTEMRPTFRIPDPDVMLRDVPGARQP